MQPDCAYGQTVIKRNQVGAWGTLSWQQEQALDNWRPRAHAARFVQGLTRFQPDHTLVRFPPKFAIVHSMPSCYLHDNHPRCRRIMLL